MLFVFIAKKQNIKFYFSAHDHNAMFGFVNNLYGFIYGTSYDENRRKFVHSIQIGTFQSEANHFFNALRPPYIAWCEYHH